MNPAADLAANLAADLAANIAVDLAALERTRDRTLPYFRADPTALARSYAPGKWTLRQFLLHLVDCEGVMLDRLRRILAEDQPLLLVFDENRWSERLFPERRDLGAAAELFAATRAAVIELTTLCPSELHARSGTHSVKGTRSFAEIVRFVHHHHEHHLDQMVALVENRPWIPRADDPLRAAPPAPGSQRPAPGAR